MARSTADEMRARAEATFELAELGEEMMRNTLRRRHPEATEEEIERLWTEWLVDCPHPSEGYVNIRRTSPEERFPE